MAKHYIDSIKTQVSKPFTSTNLLKWLAIVSTSGGILSMGWAGNLYFLDTRYYMKTDDPWEQHVTAGAVKDLLREKEMKELNRQILEIEYGKNPDLLPLKDLLKRELDALINDTD